MTFSEETVEQRKKQIKIGKETAGYKRYIEIVPIRNRKNPKHPSTPDPYAPDSKRQFDGRLKAWRRILKEYEESKPEIEWAYLPAPVTLRVENSEDEREAFEIQANNAPGSVKILDLRPPKAAPVPAEDPEAWLELDTPKITVWERKLYF